MTIQHGGHRFWHSSDEICIVTGDQGFKTPKKLTKLWERYNVSRVIILNNMPHIFLYRRRSNYSIQFWFQSYIAKIELGKNVKTLFFVRWRELNLIQTDSRYIKTCWCIYIYNKTWFSLKLKHFSQNHFSGFCCNFRELCLLLNPF